MNANLYNTMPTDTDVECAFGEFEKFVKFTNPVQVKGLVICVTDGEVPVDTAESES